MARLSDLPLSAIPHIRKYIRLRDLLTHVAFQATCRKVREAYFNDENFWQAACADAGIAKPIPAKDFPFLGAKYREIAIICANHLYMCELPMCDLWQCSAKIYDDYGNKPLSVDNGREQQSLTGFSTRLDILTGYDDDSNPEYWSTAPIDIDFMDWDVPDDRRIIHAAGLCKFATAPPLRGIWIYMFRHPFWMYNPDGLTHWDVASKVREELIHREGETTLADLVRAWQLGQTHDTFADIAAELAWLKTTTVAAATKHLYCILMTMRPERTSDPNRATVNLDAIRDVYQIMRRKPQRALLVDILCNEPIAKKHLAECTVAAFRTFLDTNPALSATYSSVPWVQNVLKYEKPIDLVRNRLIFTGIKCLPEDNQGEDRPCFRVKWGCIRDGESAVREYESDD